MTIHPTAVIEPGAQLGSNVTVGPFTYIGDRVQIGDGCQIGPQVTVLPYTTLGPSCRVHAGAVLGDLPQDFAYQDSESYVQIGSDCVIREGVTIHRGTRPGTVTRVGNQCFLMAFSHLGHNVQLGNQVIVANGALIAGYAEVGDRAFISGNCLVHQFTRIGRLAMLAGGAAVQKDVPPFCITRSLSTNTVLNLNIIGLRRAGFTSEQRLELKRAFGVLYQSGLTVSEAVQQLDQAFDSSLVHELSQFVKDSKRGICKFFRRGRSADDRMEDLADE